MIPFALARRRERGSALVEFALGATILTTLFTGTFSFGYAFYRYNTLLSAVNAGARFASLRPYDSLTASPSAAYLTAVKNMVVYNNPQGGTSPVAPGLAASNVNVSITFGGGVPQSVTVNLTGYTFTTIFGTMTLNQKPEVRYVYQGIWAPTGSL